MGSEHPKITSYIPRDILEALEKWRKEHEIDSRNAAIVAILADYLGVQHPVRLADTAPLSIHLHTVLDDMARLSQRMDAWEDLIRTACQEVLSTALEEPPESSRAVAVEVVSTAPLERAVPTSSAQNEARRTVPPAPLTQSALAQRLGCSDKAIEKHRKQGSKEEFAAWSRDRDPDGKAWTWEGSGGRGNPLRFVPLDESAPNMDFVEYSRKALI
ncbi:MAG TPA: hypothetical protein V6D26_08570 [Stenomitos sp.]